MLGHRSGLRPPRRTRAGRRRRRSPRRAGRRGCPGPAFAGGGVVSVGAVREKRGAGAGWVIAVALDERAARRQVRVLERLGHRQHRRDAGVGARRRPRPTRPGCAAANVVGDEPRAARRAARGRRGRGRCRRCRAADDQLVVELRLERRRPPGAGRRRSRRRRRTARRRRAGWRARSSRQQPAGQEAGRHRVEVGGAVDDRGVDDLALAARAGPRAARRGRRSRGTSTRRRSRRPGCSGTAGGPGPGPCRTARR